MLPFHCCVFQCSVSPAPAWVSVSGTAPGVKAAAAPAHTLMPVQMRTARCNTINVWKNDSITALPLTPRKCQQVGQMQHKPVAIVLLSKEQSACKTRIHRDVVAYRMSQSGLVHTAHALPEPCRKRMTAVPVCCLIGGVVAPGSDRQDSVWRNVTGASFFFTRQALSGLCCSS